MVTIASENRPIITPSCLRDVLAPSFSSAETSIHSKQFSFKGGKEEKLQSKDSLKSYEKTSAKTNQKAPFTQPLSSISKPNLNCIQSRNKLYEYSHSKKYAEDKIEFATFIQPETKKSLASNPKTSKESNKSDVPQENTEQPIDEYEELLLYQQKNLPVPIEKKNDEKFKLLKMKQMKRMSLPCNKSVRKYEDMKSDYEKTFENILDYSHMKKKKISHSTRKIYSSMLKCYSDGGDEVYFRLYCDKDIGIYEYWQAHIIDSKADEDVMTDDEQLRIAGSYIIGELKEAFDTIKKEGTTAFVNFNRYY